MRNKDNTFEWGSSRQIVPAARRDRAQAPVNLDEFQYRDIVGVREDAYEKKML
jgi:hypothetical protein